MSVDIDAPVDLWPVDLDQPVPYLPTLVVVQGGVDLARRGVDQ